MKIISEEKKAKIKNRHHSIKTQMIMAFVGLLICLVVTLMFINGKFLEPYYISKKESRFIELYEKLNNVSNEDKWNSARKNSSLIHFAEKNNISYLVIEKDNDVHTNVHDKNMLKNQMMGYFLNQAQKESRILDSTEVYQINQSWDPWNQNYYVDMWGSLDDGSQFLLRSPRMAKNLMSASFTDWIALSPDYSIVETPMPVKWSGKTLQELDVRRNYEVNVVGIKSGAHVEVNPDPSEVLREDMVLILVGSNKALEAL